MPPQPAERLAFTFRKCLGAGGFGEVYLAEQHTRGGVARLVAVKILKEDLDESDDAVKRLRDEGQILAMMQHPAILGVHEFTRIQGRLALVTEYIEGIDVSQYCVPDRLMPKKVAIGIVAEVASALDFAFQTPHPKTGRPLKLIHRDIKPENIRLSKHGQVKVLDFGIARSTEMQRRAKTAMGDVLMTPGYGAPEALAFGVTSEKVDVFALGASLFRMITGENFYQDRPLTFQLTLAMDTHDYAEFLAKRLDGIKSIPLRELLADMLHHTPEKRPAAGQICERAEEIAGKMKGPMPAQWARQVDLSSEEAGTDGPLVGKSVTAAGKVVEAPKDPSLPPMPKPKTPPQLPPRAKAPPPAPPITHPPLPLSLFAVLAALVVLVGCGAASTFGTLVLLLLRDPH